MTNPFTTVFTDTVDWNDPFGEEVGTNQLPTEMITIPYEEWEWRERLINFQYEMYRKLLREYHEMRQELEVK